MEGESDVTGAGGAGGFGFARGGRGGGLFSRDGLFKLAGYAAVAYVGACAFSWFVWFVGVDGAWPVGGPPIPLPRG